MISDLSRYLKINRIFSIQMESIEKLLLREEYRAERAISYVRVVFYLSILLEIVFVGFLLDNRQYLPMALPVAGMVLFSGLMLLDILAWGSKRFYRFFNRFVKYYIVTVDVGMASSIVLLAHHYNVVEMAGRSEIPLFFMAMGAILLSATVFRYSILSCIYTGTATIASFTLVMFMLGNIDSIIELFVYDGKYQFTSALLIWTTLTITAVSSLLSLQIRRLLITSKQSEKLERFLPDVVAQEIMEGKRDITIGGSKQWATIFFSDIRNFTAMSEKLPPEEVIDFLNSYFNDMIDIIFKNRGTLDKIMGDGIMAVFGYPVVTGKDASEAVSTAIDMQRKLGDFNALRALHQLDAIQIGIGIHTGEVIMGNVGTEKRMDFTAIGDAVNTASRLQDLTKKYMVPIIISEETHRNLNGSFNTVKLEDVIIRGKTAPMSIYSVAIQ